jgi:hypothetical protein
MTANPQHVFCYVALDKNLSSKSPIIDANTNVERDIPSFLNVELEYLDVTVLRRGVGEVRVVAGRAPAC